MDRMTRLRLRFGRYSRLGLWILVLLFTFQAVFPFSWSLITALKQDRDLYSSTNNPFWFNLPPTLEHVDLLVNRTAFGTFAVNTVVVAICVLAITLAVSLPAAYALGRLQLRWGTAAAVGIFMVYLIPPALLFISLSPVVGQLGLQDSRWALVVVHPTITIPVSVWLLTGYFRSIPTDIEEQAMVDGYGRFGAFLRVTLPLAVPGLIAVVVFAGTLSVGEFIYSLAFVSQTSQKTLSVGVPSDLVRGDVFFWQSLQAATLFVAVPLALLFNLFLRRFITGFTLGGVKG